MGSMSSHTSIIVGDKGNALSGVIYALPAALLVWVILALAGYGAYRLVAG